MRYKGSPECARVDLRINPIIVFHNGSTNIVFQWCKALVDRPELDKCPSRIFATADLGSPCLPLAYLVKRDLGTTLNLPFMIRPI